MNIELDKEPKITFDELIKVNTDLLNLGIERIIELTFNQIDRIAQMHYINFINHLIYDNYKTEIKKELINFIKILQDIK